MSKGYNVVKCTYSELIQIAVFNKHNELVYEEMIWDIEP